MENKNNKKELPHILNLHKPHQVFFYAQMSLKEVLISLTLIGSSSTTHQMIQKITFIELVEQQEVPVGLEELFFSYLSMR
jgi:hypothetical protein